MDAAQNDYYGIFDFIFDMLKIKPIFLLGIIVIGISLIIIFKKNRNVPKIKIFVISFLMYYYLCILFTNIVGIPTLSEFFRLSYFGERIFNPNLNLIPFNDGISLSFVLNIFLFIPLGFFSPMISKKYESIKNTVLLGFGLSLFIEIVQLFTLFRATDVDDLITNVFGTLIGYLCFRVIVKLKFVKLCSAFQSEKRDFLQYLPIIIIITAFILGFFS